MRANLTTAIHVEGLSEGGGNVIDFSSGTLFHFGAPVPDALTRHKWIEALTEVPLNIDDRVDILASTYDVSDLTFSLAMTPEVRRLFFAEADPVGVVAQVNSSAEIEVETGASFEVTDTIYIGNETLWVSEVTVLSPTRVQLGVVGGYAGSLPGTIAVGAQVYVDPPYHRPRTVTMYLINRDTLTVEVPWRGILQAIKTSRGQTECLVKAFSVQAALRDREGMQNSPKFRITKGDLEWTPGGNLKGRIRGASNAGFVEADFINPGSPSKILSVGDGAALFTLTGNDLVSNTGLTVARSEDSGVVEEDEDIFEIFAVWQGVTSSCTGCYGDPYDFVAVLLCLMLSTGKGANNPVIGPDTFNFDILAGRAGLGIPWNLFNVQTFLDILDQRSHRVTQLTLGVEGPWSFQDAIIKGLRQQGLYLGRDEEGLIALYELRTWTLDDMTRIMNAGYHAILSPGVDMDRRIERRVPVVNANVGRTAWDDKPDFVRLPILSGDRRDVDTIAQTGEVFEMDHYRKSQAPVSRDRERVLDFLRIQAAFRRDMPPVVQCELPEEHSILLGGSPGRVPGVGEWVRLRRAPFDESLLVGPDGELIDPNSTTIVFIGRLVRRTLDMRTGDVRGEVELFNWMSGDISPRLVAPSARIISVGFSATVDFTVDGQDFRSKFADSGLSVGDELRLVDPEGDADYRDTNLVVSSITEAANPIIHCSGSLAAGTYTDFRLTLADPDAYDNSTWDGAQYFDPSFSYRRYAYLADAAGRVGDTRDDPADYYN